VLFRLLLLLLLSLPPAAFAEAPTVAVAVLARLPHDREAFTQGLLWYKGALIESTGRYGASSLRRLDAQSGRVLLRTRLPDALFAEGVAEIGGELFLLTWQENQLLLGDPATLRVKRSAPYPYEGWGATSDGRHLIVSDGSALLRFLDPRSLRVLREVMVRDGTTPVAYLNELEWVEGEILANVWGQSRIARIDARTGEVRAWLDLTPLLPPEVEGDSEAVANGIAYDPGQRVLYVTGKRWPVLYQLAWPPR
jgi:glutamine cyclotransferase